MANVSLELDSLDPADARDDVRFGVLDGRRRVAMWPGSPPEPTIDHPVIAPVALRLDGEDGGQYGEAIPRGVRLVEHELPDSDLHLYVVSQVLRGLAALHAAGVTHGDVNERRIIVGEDGEVVLIGRGRVPGAVNSDILGAMALLPPGADITLPGFKAAETAAHMASKIPADTRDRLAMWVRSLVSHLDEVVPEIGDENDTTGLLDRYDGDPAMPPAGDDSADEDSSTQMNVGSTLWRALAAPPIHPAPPDRFKDVAGQPSDGIVALLEDEIVHLLAAPTTGPIEAFVVDAPVEDDPDEESSHTVKAPIVEIAAAEAAIRAAARATTPRPAPESAAASPAPEAAGGIPWGLILLAALGGGAVVALGMWFLG